MIHTINNEKHICLWGYFLLQILKYIWTKKKIPFRSYMFYTFYCMDQSFLAFLGGNASNFIFYINFIYIRVFFLIRLMISWQRPKLYKITKSIIYSFSISNQMYWFINPFISYKIFILIHFDWINNNISL